MAVTSKRPLAAFLLSGTAGRGPGRRFRRLPLPHQRQGADAPTIEEQVKANKPKAQGKATLPQEKWSYIERLENKQVDIIEPPPQPGVLPPRPPRP